MATIKKRRLHNAPGLWIETAKHLRRRSKQLSRQESTSYSLWYLKEGSARVREGKKSTRILAPALVLLGPEDKRQLHINSDSQFGMFRFLLEWRPLTCVQIKRAQTYRPEPQTLPQPPLSDLWDIPIPCPLPQQLCSDGEALFLKWSNACLLGPSNWQQANSDLLQWMLHLQTLLKETDDSVDLRSKLEHLIETKLGSRLKVRDLATMVGLSPKQLSVQLHKEDPAAPSLKDLIKLVRIKKVKRALQHSNSSISHIAEFNGYSSASALAAEFKTVVGMSPSTWRTRVPTKQNGTES